MKDLRQCGLWDELIEKVDNTRLEQAIRNRLGQEAFEEMQRRGAKSLKKTVAREIAEQVLRRAPVAAFIMIALSAKEVCADTEERGFDFALANQLFAARLIEDVAKIGSDKFQNWLNGHRFDIQVRLYLNAGYSQEEAEQMAWDRMFEFMK